MPKYSSWDDADLYNTFADEFDPLQNDRQARRKRKKKVKHEPKMSEQEIIQELADDVGIAGGFETSYKPSLYEEGWLLQSLQSFYYQDLITDVEAQVKGGKEASVYRCTPHQTMEPQWIAAKVYRPRKFRQLRNDQMYREGRAALGMNGKEINDKDWRALKAMNRGSGYGQALSHTSWLMYEYKTLKTLHEAGAAVPAVFAVSENALLMSYFGDDALPAPTLSEVQLQPDEVEPLFAEVMRNVDLMLQQGYVHGDLSAFNILYWQGDIVLIDFPQVVDIQTNRHARDILNRDITRVCEYFEALGLQVNADEIAYKLWQAYGTPEANQEEVLFNILEAVEAVEYEDEDY